MERYDLGCGHGGGKDNADVLKVTCQIPWKCLWKEWYDAELMFLVAAQS